MTRPPALVDRDSWMPFLGLLFACGMALILSIPGPRAVRDLEQLQHFTRAMGFDITRLFIYVYVLSFGLLGLRLGVVSAERRERGWGAVRRLVGRVLLGQVLCLPYLVFFRALHPGSDGRLALVAFFVTLLASLCAALSGHAEKSGGGGCRPLTGYAVFFGVALVPLAGIPFLSPVAASGILLGSSGPGDVLVAFVAPVALFAIAFTLVHRLRGLVHG